MTKKKVSIEGINIHYWREGKEGAPVVLFIHGLGGSVDYWSYLMESNLTKSFDLVAIDSVGYGFSGKPKPKIFDYTMESQAEITLKFIRELKLSVHSIVGYSMGGSIALFVEKQLPANSIKNVILVEPMLVEADLLGDTSLVTMPGWLIWIMLHSLMPFMKRSLAKEYLATNTKKGRHILISSFKRSSGTAIQLSLKHLIETARNPETYEMLRSLTCSRHYILGDFLEHHEGFIQPADMFQICKKHLIPNAKHCLMLDNPGKFNEVIKSIMTS